MSTLHLVNRSSSRGDSLTACLRALTPGDAVLLIEDGVYAALAETPDAAALAAACSTDGAAVVLHALEPDARARGVHERLSGDVELIDRMAFVRLAVSHGRVTTWL